MTYETLELIGDCYREALGISKFAVDLPHDFLKQLQSIKAKNNTEASQLRSYINQLDICYCEREKTRIVTDLLEEIIFTASKIAEWYNCTHPDQQIYGNLSFRRKSFESEFKKSLKKTLTGKSPRIKDRFGCRVIIRNKDSEEINQEYMYILTNLFIDMYCGLSSSKEDFFNWCSSSVSYISLMRIKETLSIPFELVEAEQCYDTGETSKDIVIPKKSGISDIYKYGVKDYVYTPKERGYQSLHFVLHIDSSSIIFPGLYVEFQIRTSLMHARAEAKNSSASHKNHKDDSSLVPVENMKEEVSLDDIIQFDDTTKINIIGYDNHSIKSNQDKDDKDKDIKDKDGKDKDIKDKDSKDKDGTNCFIDDSIGIRSAVCSYTRTIASPCLLYENM